MSKQFHVQTFEEFKQNKPLARIISVQLPMTEARKKALKAEQERMEYMRQHPEQFPFIEID